MVSKTNMTVDERQDVEVIAAYERRLAGGRADEVPPQWQTEVEDFVRMHQRVAAMPMADVAPSVRSVILSAAAEVAREAQVQSPLQRFLNFLFRPGPIVIGMTTAAIALALAVRPHSEMNPNTSAKAADAPAAVAAESAAAPVATLDEPKTAEAVAKVEPAAATKLQEVAAAAAVQRNVAKADEGEAAEAARAQIPRPTRTIEAQPASLSPPPRAPDDVASGHASIGNRESVNAPVVAEAPKRERAVTDDALDAKLKAPPMAGFAKDNTVQQRRTPQAPAYEAAVAKPEVAEKVVQAAPKTVVADKAGAASKAENEQAASDSPAQNDGGYRGNRGQAAPVPAVQAESKSPKKESKSEKKAQEQPADADVAPAGEEGRANLAQLRADAEKLTVPAQKAAALKKLIVAARKANDAKAEKWAMDELRALDGAAAAKSKPATESTPPAQKAKASPQNGAAEIKANKSDK